MKRQKIILIFLTVLTLVGEVGQVIWLPLWVDNVQGGRDGVPQGEKEINERSTYGVVLISTIVEVIGFTTLFFIFYKPKELILKDNKFLIFGILMSNAINSIFTPYVSDSSRNTLTTQVLMLNSYIPLTVVFRFLYLHRLPTTRKSICMVIVVLSLIFSLIPNFLPRVFPFEAHDDVTQTSGSRFLWSLGFVGLAVFPAVSMNSFLEKLFNSKKIITKRIETDDTTEMISKPEDLFIEVNENSIVLSIYVYMSVFQLIALLLSFWIELIPNFGYANSIKEFIPGIRDSILCSFGQAGCSYQTIGYVVGFTVSYIISNVFGSFLIMKGEGGTFWALTTNMVTPIGVLFWILFEEKPLRWGPSFSKGKWFSVIAILIMAPALVIYNTGSKENKCVWKRKRIWKCFVYLPSIVRDEDSIYSNERVELVPYSI